MSKINGRIKIRGEDRGYWMFMHPYRTPGLKAPEEYKQFLRSFIKQLNKDELLSQDDVIEWD